MEEPDGDTTFVMSSPGFESGADIPVRYAHGGVAGGENLSVPIEWSQAPGSAKSFALLMFDTHPVAHDWVHWMVVDIPPDVTSLPEGASGIDMPDGAVELANSFGETGYGGPQPPSGSGSHEYLVTIYALDTEHLEVASDAGLREFLDALDGHVLAEATFTGVFSR